MKFEQNYSKEVQRGNKTRNDIRSENNVSYKQEADKIRKQQKEITYRPSPRNGSKGL